MRLMAMAITKKLQALREEVSEFAKNHFSGSRDTAQENEFPWDIWQRMAEQGLHGLTIPAEFGGREGGWLSLAVAGRELVKGGAGLGLALSLLLNQAAAKSIICKFGSLEQQKKYLPDMAGGKIVGCLAMSEPKTGAHPAHMRTMAAADNNGWILNGEKTYLTNGPIADLFVVMAVTGEDAGRKNISAFLVSGDNPGLRRTDPMILDFLKPSPHGGIVLKDAIAPSDCMLGGEGEAYEKIIRPFREFEDAMLMGPFSGAMDRAIMLSAGLIKQADDETKLELGKLKALADLAAIMAYESAGYLDDENDHPEFLSLLIAGRDLVKNFLSTIDSLTDRNKLEFPDSLSVLMHDLKMASKLASGVMARKQIKIGESLLNKNGS